MNNKNEKLRLTVKAALFAAMLCVLSPLTIPAGAVPFSLSLAAVYLCGAFQTPLYAVASTVCDLILGACGLPVFSNFSGGIGKLIGPTGGYLFSYPLTALAVALSVKLFKKRSVLSLSVGMTVGCLLSYTCGTLYYMAIGGVSLGAALASCVVPFIWFDVLKIVFCTALGTLVGRRMEKNI